MSRRRLIFGALAVSCGLATFITACATSTSPQKTAGDVYEDDPSNPVLNPPRPPDYVNNDSGAFGTPSARANEGGTVLPEGGRVSLDDAGPPATSLDSGGGPSGDCVGPLLLGDVKIVELMINSQDGVADKGEWVEIQSTRDCTLNVNGLTISSPRGTDTDTVTISEDTFIPPNGTFVVGDSDLSALNGALPPILFSWESYDVLKNTGDTVNVMAGATLIDTLTYPDFTTLTPGRSLSFPADCAWSDRADWARWSYSFNVYSGVLEGTPNADNIDVACY
jgi:hypothetical protein